MDLITSRSKDESERKEHLESAVQQWLQNHSSCPSSSRVFLSLLHQLLHEPAFIDWSSWNPLSDSKQVSLSHLPTPSPSQLPSLLRRLAVIRLNGGLGTTMGCYGPKSLITVKDGHSFLEVSLRQHESLVNRTGVSIPLLLMNSFATHEETENAVGGRARCFCQSKCPRLDAKSLLPLPDEEDSERWYPPGHGNVFVALEEAGLLSDLLRSGHDILFISNIDNTGATPSAEILSWFASENVEYAMECTEKTQADLKGGTLIEIHGRPMHLEMPQVPPDHVDDFCSTNIFKIFNTNNIWVNARSVSGRSFDIRSEIILNRKKTSTGREVIQLEASIGGAIRNFERAFCVHVPRSRFIPVKGTADLLGVCSDLFSLDLSSYCLLPLFSPPPPRITLSSHFSSVSSLRERFPVWPSLRNLRSLSIQGDFQFEGECTFEGDVTLTSSVPVVVPAGQFYSKQVINLSQG